MKERPILFSAAMVRAILNGTKTQTRRVAKLTANGHVKEPGGHRRWHTADFDARLACPYGQPGDLLWVREAWAPHPLDGRFIFYRERVACEAGFPVWSGPWKPGIHMPRWASRITLKITGVRVERLQDISDADARAEGIYTSAARGIAGMDAVTRLDGSEVIAMPGIPRMDYCTLWEQINGAGSWDANPLVWVIEFHPIDAATSAADSR